MTSKLTRTLRFPVLLVFLVLAPGCAPERTTLTVEARADIEQAVRAAVDAFADAERERDVDAIVDFIAPDFYMYTDGSRNDYDTVVEQIRSTMPSLRQFETTWSDVEVTVLAHDHALVTLFFRDVITDGDGATTRFRGPTSFVWALREGSWRIIYADADHYPDPV